MGKILPRKVIFIRHGNTINYKELGSVVSDLYASTDVPLNEKGEFRSRAMGPGFRKRFGVPDVVIRSPYLRARQTCDLLLEAYSEEERQAMLIFDNALVVEREAGITFGMRDAEVLERFPDYKRELEEKGDFFARLPGGESLHDVVEGRAKKFMEMLTSQEIFNDKVVVVFSHKNFITALRVLMEKPNLYNFANVKGEIDPKYGCVTVYVPSDDGYSLMLEEADISLS